MSKVLQSLVLFAFTRASVNADLGAAIRRAKGQTVSLPMDALSKPVVVPLKRVDARLVDGGKGSFYVGDVTIGQPAQKMKVLFDTSSGHVLLPHRACSKPACVEHRRYSPWESATAIDVNIDGKMVQEGHRLAKGNVTRQGVKISFTQADLGEGEANSVVVRDHVCLGAGGESCIDMELLAALNLEDKPFRAMPNDGIVGLGLEGLSSGPLCSFIGRFLAGSRALLPQFGISFGVENGEIHFGGHDASRLAAPLQWLPVDHPEQGYWQVAILAVRVGGVTIDACSQGCHGVVDTGASRLGVQESNLPKLHSALALSVFTDGACQGPDLTFDLGGVVLTLESSDYTNAECSPQLGPLNLEEPQFTGVYAFGETVLRRYYAAFDWEAKRIGFSRIAQHSVAVSEKSVIV